MKALLKQAVVSLAACIALISSSVGNLTLSLGGGFSFKSRMHPANGSGANLHWLVNDEKIAPHILVIDKSKREDGSFSRDDFTFDKGRNVYKCPAGKILKTTGQAGQRRRDPSLHREHTRLQSQPAQGELAPRRCLLAGSSAMWSGTCQDRGVPAIEPG